MEHLGVVASSIDTSQVRALLERTGRLRTSNPDDVGHIPDVWRQTITDLCNAVDGLPTDAVEPEAAQVEALLASVRNVVAPDLEPKIARLTWLVENAIPRMRTLDNVFSRRWLAMTEALFERSEV